ncbi:MAG: COX15/CtaA family protein [Flavobacteriaceae bacterium]|nr:COX15/CtaA family protein [Flavobacteriaceae bacterium]
MSNNKLHKSFINNSLKIWDKQLITWLIIGCLLITTMIIVGGITRLTHSGLSMVTWKPVTGFIPPLNELEWQIEFTKYKTSPEYIKKNYHFSLDEFKEIFFWEYVHRLIGRILGLVFFFPFLYFLIKKKIKTKKLRNNLWVIFFLGALQGFVGWFMVKSGLVDNPAVSHYRLATHLVLALFLFSYIYWIILQLRFPEKETPTKDLKKIASLAQILLFLTTLQIIYGAFVAGLKAGKLHHTFPKMGIEWFPKMIIESFKQNGIMTLFENHYAVIFIHRWLAVIVFFLVLYLVFKAQNNFLSLNQKWAIRFVLITIGIQFLLGVYTILYSVPVILGVLHQFGALVFLISILTVLFFFRNKNYNKSISDLQNKVI